MRPLLGVAVDDGEVVAALVDADVPQLGPFDSRRWAPDPDLAVGAAVSGAVTAMIERAGRVSLTIDRIAVVVSPAAATAEVLAAVHAATGIPVEAVDLDRARTAFLTVAHDPAEYPMLALHTRTGGAEAISIVDVAAGAVRASVVRAGDALTGYTATLPEVADEAIARAATPPHAVVFLDRHPGDTAAARELSTILEVPLLTPPGVPWHRATGAALAAAQAAAPAPTPVPAGPDHRRTLLLAVVLLALAALLGGGLALAGGGFGDDPGRDTPARPTVVESPVPIPPAPGGTSAPADPCATVHPASWPAPASDPEPDPGPGETPGAPADPCATVPPQP